MKVLLCLLLVLWITEGNGGKLVPRSCPVSVQSSNYLPDAKLERQFLTNSKNSEIAVLLHQRKGTSSANIEFLVRGLISKTWQYIDLIISPVQECR